MPGTRRRSAQWLISVSRDGLHAADFIMSSVSWTIPSKIYSRDLGSARPQETRVCEEIRLCHPGFGTPQHRSSLASEEHICGLTSPARPDATRWAQRRRNRPGATPKAEQNAATPGGCCHKRLPTPPVTLPNVPGRAPWWFSTDDKPSSNNQSDTVHHLNIKDT